MSNPLDSERRYASSGARRVRLILWPPPYGLATLSKVPELDQLPAGGAPVVVVVTAAEITLAAPVAVLDAAAASTVTRDDGWRALTLDAEFSLDTVGVLATLTGALAAAKVPVMAFSSYATDHLLVPEQHLGRALAALAQVSLPVSSP
jgi:hypothetical protein